MKYLIFIFLRVFLEAIYGSGLRFSVLHNIEVKNGEKVRKSKLLCVCKLYSDELRSSSNENCRGPENI